ncbi:MAG: glycosyltransferase family 2 protein [Vicinamibacteria bacterium]
MDHGSTQPSPTDHVPLEPRRVTVVVPFLDEEENLEVLHSRLAAALAGEPEAFELLFVDDGSTDSSVRRVRELAARDPRVKLLRLSRNFGHQLAITAGMDHAAGDAVVILDADLQDPPEVIPRLLERWREGHEVVYAVRRNRRGETLSKRFLAAAFYKSFRRLASVDVPIDSGDFRLVDRKVVDALVQVRELHRFVRGLTCWVGFSQCAVGYDREARHAGQTKYPVWKSARLAWDAITSFSSLPLRWMTVIGALVSVAGLVQAVRVVVDRLLYPGSMERGWASIVALMLFLGGVQLLSLGLMGQYIGRIYEESKKRPLYFVKEKLGAFDPRGSGPTRD